MSSFYVKALLFATLALASALAMHAQSMPAPDVTATVHSTIGTPASSSNQLASISANDAVRSSSEPGETKVAEVALSTAPVPLIAQSGHSGDVVRSRGLKEWMLVAIGLFLIGTISQRRIRSTMD